MFKSFGPTELIIILVIVLLIFGAGKLANIGGALGKSIREFKKSSQGEDEKKPEEKTNVQSSETNSKEKTKI
ncbi:MAG: twin-arginine translocase TatA/TatE family subunit [Chloroflexi bacterium]|nr:twin-arginine translocase TatA/TatE family subunit [Chloroflexota bacterium]